MVSLVGVALWLFSAGQAWADFGVVPGSYTAGVSSTQAGAHPDLTIGFTFNSHPVEVLGALPDEDPHTAIINLPPGLVGNPQAYPKCSADFAQANHFCPADTQVGVLKYAIGGFPVSFTPIYNMVPQNGRVAEFGFVNIRLAAVQIHILASVRTGSDYGVTTTLPALPSNLGIFGSVATIWGVPGDPVHDEERGSYRSPAPPNCLEPLGGTPGVTCPGSAPPRPFLSNPTVCGRDEAVSFTADSWENPGSFLPLLIAPAQQMTGCYKVPFSPVYSMQPVSHEPGEPSAYQVDLDVPQTDSSVAPAASHVKHVRVILPEGVRVSPSSADGLGACTPVQIALHSSAGASCPDSAKIGSVTIETPLLEKPLSGSVYLASPHDNPFGSLLAVYIVAEGSGVVVKTPGEVQADPQTGQLSVIFDDLPQVPFSHLHLRLSGGARAALTTPSQCGTYTTHALLAGWNGNTVTSDSTFDVSGGNDRACSSVFAPILAAGTVNPVAGAFSPLTARLTRIDADSEFNALSLNLPPGLLADLGSVPVRCTDAQAAAAACPADSHVGTVTVGAGAGPDPFYVNGDVYLTGPYNGAPFGVAVIVRAKAGPFDLGNVVVRAAVQVHSDGTVTTSTDPLPTILQGIPLQVKDIRVAIDRPRFILNPTSCSTMSFGGLVSSTDGQTAGLGSRFQVGECTALAFRPSFRVSTQARTSKANGASLDVKVTSGAGQANLAKTVVTLPKQLPARLTTIQQACLAATFAANPATCPAASAIGVATATTPILASPVTGPAYLVSHGGAAFPDVVMILQGEGVTVNVTGGVNIKKGVTTATFDSIPDVPISTFELKLPTGPHSGLGSNLPAKAKGSMCGQNLTMPTTLAGQNGAQVKQNTKIAVTGCPRTKKKHKATRKKQHTRRAKGGHASAKGGKGLEK